MAADGSPTNVFAGLKGTAIKTADATDLRGRDRYSIADLNQFAVNYDGSYFDDLVHLAAGVRLPYFRRELNQYCYTQYQSNTAYCTTQAPSVPVANLQPDASTINMTTFATSPGTGATTKYVAPFKGTRKYDKVLPNVGLSIHPFGEDHQFYVSFAEGVAAPRTDNLYSFEILNVQPETTQPYDFGYRYQHEGYMVSAALWKTDFKNRIVTSFDPNLGINVDRNIGPVDLYGFDFEGGITPIEDLSVYASVSYNHSKVINNIQSGAIMFPTAGKKLVETPTLTYSTRISYKIKDFTFGAQAKYVGQRFSTDVNNEFTPSYATVDANIRYALESLPVPGLKTSYLQVNLTNLFDKLYLASISTQFSTASGIPLYSIGARRTFQASFHFTF
ncbi:MAG: TonB-dependent receptor [Rhodospirillaceae bacterium]|nr:TonB-dependent receptor [Rhodospirillaceae bacterium]